MECSPCSASGCLSCIIAVSYGLCNLVETLLELSITAETRFFLCELSFLEGITSKVLIVNLNRLHKDLEG